jgi:protease-4
MSERKGPSAGCIIALATTGLAMMGVCAVVLVLLFGGSGSEVSHGDKIAQIDLDGVISSSSVESLFGDGDESMVTQLAADLKRAREDDSIKAVVLRINSPGGEVTAADTIYHHVKKTAAVKPVVVYMDSMAASGGFYVACAANEIIANRTTMTGSIGVIISTMSYHTLFTKLGLESVVFTSGKFKDTLSGSRAMRPEEKELIQGMVNQTYERFLEVVKEGRPKVPEDKLRASLADGRIISGQDALASGLIDANGYLEDAHQRARELAKAPGAEVIRIHEEESLLEAIGLMQAAKRGAGGRPQSIELRLTPSQAPVLQPGMLYLLPPFYAQ